MDSLIMRGRPPVYEWDKLLDGAPHIVRLRRPAETTAPKWDEIDTPVLTFRKAASAMAKKRNMKVSITDDGGQYFLVQAYPIGTRKPHLDLFNQKIEDKSEPPDENLCQICGGLIQGGTIAVGMGYRTCQILDGWDRVGPFHEEDTGEYDHTTT